MTSFTHICNDAVFNIFWLVDGYVTCFIFGGGEFLEYFYPWTTPSVTLYLTSSVLAFQIWINVSYELPTFAPEKHSKPGWNPS